MKFKKRVSSILVVVFAVVILGMMGFSLFFMNRSAVRQTEEIGRMRLENIAVNMQKMLDRGKNSLLDVAAQMEILKKNSPTEEQIHAFLVDRQKSAREKEGEDLLNYYYISGDTVVLSNSEAPEDYDVQDRMWYKELSKQEKGQVYISPVYQDVFTDKMCFTLALFLADGKSIVGVDYEMSRVQTYIREMGRDEEGDAFIVNGSGTIVGCSGTNLVGEKLSDKLPEYKGIFQQMVEKEGENLIFHTKTGGSRNTIFCSRIENGWYLMLRMSDWELYRDNYIQLLFVCLLILLLIAAITIFFICRYRERIWAARAKEEIERQGVDVSVRWNQRFQRYIMAVIILTMVATILGIGTRAHNSSKTQMREEVTNYGYQVESWIQEQKNVLDMFVNVIAAEPSMLDNYQGMVDFLDNVTKKYEKISATYIANPDFKHGHPMVMNNGWVPASDYVEEERTWYVDALKAKDFNVTEPYYDARTGKYCITFSKAVKSARGKFLGVFAIDFYLEELTKILGDSYTEDGYAFLVDKDGQIINHPNPEYQALDGKFVNIHGKLYENIDFETEMMLGEDYDGKYRVFMEMKEAFSNIRVIVAKNAWSIYGDVVRPVVLYLVLFGVCIFSMNFLIRKMIRWQISANERLKESADAAHKADKAKSQFLAQMSHEIRTPINAVLGMNEMVLRESDSEDVREYAENIKSAGNTLLALINGILDFSKIEDGKMEIIPVEYDLSSLINDLVNMISSRARNKGLEFALEISPDLPQMLYGDDLRLRQIITNLLTNAVKYTQEGSVVLHMTGERQAEDIILRVEVEDTGMGIRAEDLDKLFTSFQRLDEEKNRSIEGTGLGISITNSLLRMMGSKLEVESRYGEGSRFYFSLRQRVVQEEPIGDYRKRFQESQQQTQAQSYVYAPEARVLVVDDNSMNLKVAASLMKRNGIVPDRASSGKECLDFAVKNRYDIIFLDHMMPEMDGIETLKALKDTNVLPDGTVVVVMTANAIVGAREEYMQNGFQDYISKPIVVRELEDLLKRYLPPEKVTMKTAEEKRSAEAETEDTYTQAELMEMRESLPGVDVLQGLSYCMESREMYQEMLQQYLEAVPLEGLAQRREREDWSEYQIQVHALKSTSRSIGAEALSRQAAELEGELKQGKTGEAQEHGTAFEKAYEEMLSRIAEYLQGEG